MIITIIIISDPTIISNRVDIEVKDAAKVMRILQNKTARAQLV